jgi:hypothetical protein
MEVLECHLRASPAYRPMLDVERGDRLGMGGLESALDGDPAAGAQSALRGIFGERDRQAPDEQTSSVMALVDELRDELLRVST